MNVPRIAIINLCHLISDEQVKRAIPDLQAQIDEDFAPWWGTHADLVFAKRGREPMPCWPVYLLNKSDEDGALGYHDDQRGRVFGRVFVGDCLRDGISWTVDLSHELLEMLADPAINRVVRIPGGSKYANGLAAVEPCDAVEDDGVAYFKRKTLVSDFVLPCYYWLAQFEGLWDFQARLAGPCPNLTGGGYQSVSMNGAAWEQIEARTASGIRSARAIRASGRRGRRGVPVIID